MRSRFAFVLAAVLALSVSATSFAQGSSNGQTTSAASKRNLDANRDHALSADEVTPADWAVVQTADVDHDGIVTQDELHAAHHVR